jgi:4-amino-4-deoxy-L-arabinose transferase-like glycosyltransferase
MPLLYATLSLLSLTIAAYWLTCLFRPRTRVDGVFVFATAFSLLIVVLGYLLSLLHVYGQFRCWSLGSVAALLLTGTPLWCCSAALRRACLSFPRLPVDITRRVRTTACAAGSELRASMRRVLAGITHEVTFPRRIVSRLCAARVGGYYQPLVLLLLGVTLLFVIIGDLIVLVSFEPGNWDVLAYHLARVAYYIQHNSLNAFPANYWAVIVHPKISAILMTYVFLAFGMSARLTQLVQFAAYLLTMLAIYGIARFLGAARKASVFAALLFGLLPICIMEAVTGQNDLLQTAYLGMCLYSLLAYRAYREWKYLCLTAVTVALAIGVKSSIFGVLPSLLPLTLLALVPVARQAPRRFARDLAIGMAALCVAVTLITLPAGYLENVRLFHNPFGPMAVRKKHSFEGHSHYEMLVGGSLNLLRYASDFLVCDGMKPGPTIDRITQVTRDDEHTLLAWLGMHPEIRLGTRGDFYFDFDDPNRSTLAHENRSYWGVLGFLLAAPVVLLALFRRHQSSDLRLFALASIIFYLVQCFISPYDPFRGRYFLTGGIFTLPLLAFIGFPTRRLLVQVYVGLVIILGCLSACQATLYRYGTALLPYNDGMEALAPTFGTTRTDQLGRQALYLDLDSYDKAVPPGSIVAVDTYDNLPEFDFFGAHLERTLLPLNPFYGPRPTAIPPQAQFLLFSEDSRFRKARYPSDIQLRGSDFKHCTAIFLRDLRTPPTPSPTAKGE